MSNFDLGINIKSTHCLFVSFTRSSSSFSSIICADLTGTAPAPLVPASLLPATPKTHSAVSPQEVTSDCWWAAIRRRNCTAAESLPWCSVMPVLIEHTRDSMPPLCPLLTTMLAKSRSQTECASSPESRTPLYLSLIHI